MYICTYFPQHWLVFWFTLTGGMSPKKSQLYERDMDDLNNSDHQYYDENRYAQVNKRLKKKDGTKMFYSRINKRITKPK